MEGNAAKGQIGDLNRSDSTNKPQSIKANRSGMNLPSLDMMAFWANLSVVVLTVGAAVAGGFALYFNTKLGVIKDADLDRFKVESAATIASADARAAEANAKAADAGVGTAKALAQAASASERAQALELEVAKSNLELAKLKTPRTLTLKQQDRIIALLKPFAGTPFDFFVHTDPEAIDLMGKLGTVLEAAGWVRQAAAGRGVVFRAPGKPPAGIVVFTGLEIQVDESRKTDWAAAVVALQESLNAEGIATTALALIDGSEAPNAIHIKIGKKP